VYLKKLVKRLKLIHVVRITVIYDGPKNCYTNIQYLSEVGNQCSEENQWHIMCIFHVFSIYLLSIITRDAKIFKYFQTPNTVLSGIWSTEETTLKMDPQITHAFGIHVTQHRNSTYLQLHCHYLLWCYSFLYQNTRSYK